VTLSRRVLFRMPLPSSSLGKKRKKTLFPSFPSFQRHGRLLLVDYKLTSTPFSFFLPASKKSLFPFLPFFPQRIRSSDMDGTAGRPPPFCLRRKGEILFPLFHFPRAAPKATALALDPFPPLYEGMTTTLFFFPLPTYPEWEGSNYAPLPSSLPMGR